MEAEVSRVDTAPTRVSERHCKQCGPVVEGCKCKRCKRLRLDAVRRGMVSPPYGIEGWVGQEFRCTKCRRWRCWCRGAADFHASWCDDCVAACRCVTCKKERAAHARPATY